MPLTTHQEVLVLNRSVALQGIFPPLGDGPGDSVNYLIGGNEPILGEIHIFAFNFAPRGFALAQGQLLPISQNTALFSLLGTDYGGNGASTFALPDLRGRVSTDQGGGTVMGETGGISSVALTQAMLPATSGGTSAEVGDGSQPFLTTNFFISSFGQVFQVGFGFTPDNYIPCDGRTLLIADYPNLWSVIGTTYGGDGQTTFQVPDLRGRIIVGADATHPLGTAFGTTQHFIGLANMPTNMGGSGVPIDNTQPSLALNFIIALEGVYPSRNLGSEPFLGEIIAYAGAVPPDGWVFAAGQILPINQNQALFSLLGTIYGGNGQSTFALPDLRGRAIEGWGVDSQGVNHDLGALEGQDQWSITSADIPALTINGTGAPETFYGGDAGDTINGAGGNDTLVGNGGVDHLNGGDGDDTLNGGPGDNVLTGGANDDTFHMETGGADSADGGPGNDTFYVGTAFTAADHIDGGEGVDQVGLEGNYLAGLVLGAGSLANVEVLAVLPGFDYSLTTNDANVAAGQTLTVYGAKLGPGDDFTFNGAAETDGAFTMFGGLGVDHFTGGAGADGFLFGPGRWGPSDTVNGGAGGNDQLALDGNYTLTLGAGISNIEVLALLQKTGQPLNSFNITAADALVAAGQTLTVYGVPQVNGFTFNGAAEADGAFRIFGGQGADQLTGGAGADWFHGGAGGDTIRGGPGGDTFHYDSATESSGTGFDTLADLSVTLDRIDLPGVHDTYASASGRLDLATFDTDLASALGGMTGGQAILFSVDSGSFSGGRFLIVDGNGVAGYQAGQDYVFCISPVGGPPSPPISSPPDFII